MLTCEAEHGVCAMCYGRSLATGGDIELGEAVGVIAAQSIGEPGTQLTMRTFHTGGVAGASGDIAGGLPRVVELFEARSPRGKATLARTSGVVRLTEDEGRGRTITIVGDDGTEDAYLVPSPSRLEVKRGPGGRRRRRPRRGPRDPKELLDIKGVRETQVYLVNEVQRVYRDQGVSIHDKHIELIVRQMTRRVAVQEPGESHFLPGERVDARVYAETNRALVQEGKVPAEGRPELMGITKASLATDSWLSAASFQETTRVLTEAAIESRSDSLLGLKENIIIGKLIPAGTGHGPLPGVRDPGPRLRADGVLDLRGGGRATSPPGSPPRGGGSKGTYSSRRRGGLRRRRRVPLGAARRLTAVPAGGLSPGCPDAGARRRLPFRRHRPLR